METRWVSKFRNNSRGGGAARGCWGTTDVCMEKSIAVLGFTLFHTKEGGIMSDFEMISVVIMLFMLVISVMSLYKNDK